MYGPVGLSSPARTFRSHSFPPAEFFRKPYLVTYALRLVAQKETSWGYLRTSESIPAG